MKKLIITILGLFCAVNIYAQELTLDFCVGTWEYKNPTTGEEFSMKLRKTQLEIPKVFGGGMRDCLVGVYTHKKNGTVLADCMSQFLDNKEAIYFPIWIIPYRDNMLSLIIEDFNLKNGYGNTKLMGGSSRLYLISQNPKKIRMVLVDDGREGLYVDSNDIYPSGTTLPTDIILTKIE